MHLIRKLIYRIPTLRSAAFSSRMRKDFPATGGELRYVPPYTYGFVPHFADEKLASLSLTLKGDSEERLRFLLKEAACPRLNAWEFAGSNLPCAYQVEHDRVQDVYFPDDIFPQGVAVGWGVVPE
ncbi:hypothetical protein [Oligoflexus tunisiensis]|uniref:hypothetical protein n=1 Tax=Oligoflexus tunisiensis TaxID=708132 RepID=UPI001C4086F0|nr:hypothetical protein [Oligoflexus tunisiensis]